MICYFQISAKLFQQRISLKISSRNIITSVNFKPEIFGSILSINSSKNHQSPTFFEIIDYKNKLAYILKDNTKFLDGIKEKIHQAPHFKAMTFNAPLEKDSYHNPTDHNFNTLLGSIALFNLLNIDCYYGNYSQTPVAVEVPSNQIFESLGHQDNLSEIDQRKNVIYQPMTYLALINIFSNSLTRTWVKDSATIVARLKSENIYFYHLIKNHKFDLFSRDNNLMIRNHSLINIIAQEEYLKQYSSDVFYKIAAENLDREKPCDHEIYQAFELLKKIANDEKDKHYFTLNNLSTQIAIIDNLKMIHGREGLERKSQKSLTQAHIPKPSPQTHRHILAVPLRKTTNFLS